jgi:hypothetical protein
VERNVQRIDAMLSAAHKLLWQAQELAGELRTDDLREDLWQLGVECNRVHESILTKRRSRPALVTDRAYL